MNKRILISIVAIAVLAGGIGLAMWQSDNADEPEVAASPSDSQQEQNDQEEQDDQEDTGQTTTPEDNESVDQAVNRPIQQGSVEFRKITENERFMIRERGGTYYVTLYAIINRPDQYEQYRQQLRQYKKEANDHLASKGVDINRAKINYEPEEANDL